MSCMKNNAITDWIKLIFGFQDFASIVKHRQVTDFDVWGRHPSSIEKQVGAFDFISSQMDSQVKF